MSSSSATRDARGLHRRGQAYAALAAVAWSTAGLMQRHLSADTATQVVGRALFATIALFLFVALTERRGAIRAFTRMGRAEIAVAVTTAVASGTFIVALNYTTVANVLFLQAVAPIAAGVIAWLALREPVSRRTFAAMAIALAGVGVMVGGPGGAGGLGLALSAVMTLSFALSVVITRHRRDISMAPALCLSQVLVVVAVGPFADPGSAGARDLGLLFLLGFGQMGLGLAFLTMSARLIPAAELALITLLELALGPLWVWLAFSEQPGAATMAGGAVVVVAVVLQARGERAEPPAHGRWRGRRVARRRADGYAPEQ